MNGARPAGRRHRPARTHQPARRGTTPRRCGRCLMSSLVIQTGRYLLRRRGDACMCRSDLDWLERCQEELIEIPRRRRPRLARQRHRRPRPLHPRPRTCAVGATKKVPADGGAVAGIRCIRTCSSAGRVVAVDGPSGRGNPTLLQLLGGLEMATSGQIWLDASGSTGSPDPLCRASAPAYRFRSQFFKPSCRPYGGGQRGTGPALLPGRRGAARTSGARNAAELLCPQGRAHPGPPVLSRTAAWRWPGRSRHRPSLLLPMSTGIWTLPHPWAVLRLLRGRHAQGQTIFARHHDPEARFGPTGRSPFDA